jgi:hypothetical protein
MHCRIAHYATGTRKIRAEAGLEMCIALLATVEPRVSCPESRLFGQVDKFRFADHPDQIPTQSSLNAVSANFRIAQIGRSAND